ncbi:unnamed protein product [Sympodiomycopsis kandeliae]
MDLNTAPSQELLNYDFPCGYDEHGEIGSLAWLDRVFDAWEEDRAMRRVENSIAQEGDAAQVPSQIQEAVDADKEDKKQVDREVTSSSSDNSIANINQPENESGKFQSESLQNSEHTTGTLSCEANATVANGTEEQGRETSRTDDDDQAEDQNQSQSTINQAIKAKNGKKKRNKQTPTKQNLCAHCGERPAITQSQQDPPSKKRRRKRSSRNSATKKQKLQSADAFHQQDSQSDGQISLEDVSQSSSQLISEGTSQGTTAEEEESAASQDSPNDKDSSSLEALINDAQMLCSIRSQNSQSNDAARDAQQPDAQQPDEQVQITDQTEEGPSAADEVADQEDSGVARETDQEVEELTGLQIQTVEDGRANHLGPRMNGLGDKPDADIDATHSSTDAAGELLHKSPSLSNQSPNQNLVAKDESNSHLVEEHYVRDHQGDKKGVSITEEETSHESQDEQTLDATKAARAVATTASAETGRDETLVDRKQELIPKEVCDANPKSDDNAGDDESETAIAGAEQAASTQSKQKMNVQFLLSERDDGVDKPSPVSRGSDEITNKEPQVKSNPPKRGPGRPPRSSNDVAKLKDVKSDSSSMVTKARRGKPPQSPKASKTNSLPHAKAELSPKSVSKVKRVPDFGERRNITNDDVLHFFLELLRNFEKWKPTPLDPSIDTAPYKLVQPDGTTLYYGNNRFHHLELCMGISPPNKPKKSKDVLKAIFLDVFVNAVFSWIKNGDKDAFNGLSRCLEIDWELLMATWWDIEAIRPFWDSLLVERGLAADMKKAYKHQVLSVREQLGKELKKVVEEREGGSSRGRRTTGS